MQPMTMPPSHMGWASAYPAVAGGAPPGAYPRGPLAAASRATPTPAPKEDFFGPAQDPSEAGTFDWPNKHGMENAEFKGAAPKALKVKPKTIIISLAMLVIFLLLVIPMWNCIDLLEDTVYSYMTMASTPISAWLLGCSILLFVVSFIILVVFMTRSRPEMRTEHTLLMIAGIFLSTLGITLILFSGPLGKQGAHASDELFNDCREGLQSRRLYQSFKELESLRQMPHCITQDSVEDCAGYEAYPKMREARVLKAMESKFLCSGMCEGLDSKGKRITPPTLFNRANYTLSCNAMAARHITNYVQGIATQTEYEGIMLVVTAIVISFGQLISFCAKDPKNREEAAPGKDYGATL